MKMHFSGSIPLKSLKNLLHSIMVLVQTDTKTHKTFLIFQSRGSLYITWGFFNTCMSFVAIQHSLFQNTSNRVSSVKLK